jgi:HEAT repeat protein
MLDPTGKKLVRLLQPDFPADVRRASARVMAELDLRDEELIKPLCDATDDPDEGVRLQALITIGQLHVDRALPLLLARVKQGGVEAEAAAQSAARLGAKGIRALQDLMSHVAPGLRRRIAGALGVGGTPTAGTAALDALLDTDPGVVDAAVRSLVGEIASMSEAQRRGLAGHILELMRPRKRDGLASVSQAALIRLLATLGDRRGEAILWERINANYPAELRAAALQALGTMSPPKDAARVRRLLGCAADPDFRVAAPAMMILKSLDVPIKDLKHWLPLLDAPDVAVRRFAMEKLADRDHPGVALALLRQLEHPDRSLKEEAFKRLGKTDAGRKSLTEKLLEADSPEHAWSLARAQAPFVRDYKPALLAAMVTRTLAYVETSDRRADALLFLLREVDPARLRDRLEERGLALRKKRAYSQALNHFRILARDPACSEANRFELAACGIKLSGHDLAVEARNADLSLQQFARLIHSHDVSPAERLRKARWLDPEDLFYLGFHFAEGNTPERDFGALALRLVLQRSPRSKLGKDAKTKLRNAGLD